MSATEKLLLEFAANYSSEHGWEQFKTIACPTMANAAPRELAFLVKVMLEAVRSRKR
jgi:hypothetical protein